ncbi:MAG: putative DNA binding domain-containing protein [Treponema sp.]|nr:putative DNA binding domain-containing protein [Treponema sp.]
MIENTTTEFKREFNDKVIHTMLAFLNTAGGTLYLGLSDDGSVYGIEGDIDLETRRITDSFRNNVTPDPSPFFNIEPEKLDDKYIIKITVKQGSAVPYCYIKYGLVPQGVYVRIGSNTVMAAREHIRQMIKDNGAGQFIAELSIEQNLTFEYADRIFYEKDVKFELQQKQSLGLISSDGRYTNLALIISDQCPHTTKAAIFEGTNKEVFKDRKEFSGSIFKQIDDVLTYLHVFNRSRGTFEGVYRVDYADYPDISLRETYINALIHRDYYIEGSILISMFDDRLEFMSLGGVMPGVTHDLMLTGVSVTRNGKLAQILYRLNIIEAFGTGIPRIYSAYGNSAVKPEIPVVDGGFLMRIPNRNYNRNYNYQSFQQSFQQVKEKEVLYGTNEQILLKSFSNTAFSKEDASKLLNITESGAYKLLERMKEQGLLNARKSGKKWIYSLR